MNNAITISGRFDTGSVLDLIKTLENRIKELGNLNEIEDLVIDFSDLEYIDSNISVILFAYIRFLDKNFKLKINILAPKSEKVESVLFKNNFCSLWAGISLEDFNSTYLPITECLGIDACIKFNVNNLLPKLKLIEMSDENAFEFISAILEINQNAFQHGRCDNLYICGQFFPNQHELKLTLFNFGKTFKQNLISYLKSKKENTNLNYNAIQWATKNENTTDPNSAGTGLTRFIDILNKYNSQITIISDNEILYNTNLQKFNAKLVEISLQGCLINVIFHLNDANCIKYYGDIDF